MLVEARSWVGEKKPISTIMISIKISLEEHWGMRAVLIGKLQSRASSSGKLLISAFRLRPIRSFEAHGSIADCAIKFSISIRRRNRPAQHLELSNVTQRCPVAKSTFEIRIQLKFHFFGIYDGQWTRLNMSEMRDEGAINLSFKLGAFSI